MIAKVNPFTGAMDLSGIPYQIFSRPPVHTDVSYGVPTLWIDDSNDALWILLRISGSVAYWLLVGTIDPYAIGSEAGADITTESGDTMIVQ